VLGVEMAFGAVHRGGDTWCSEITGSERIAAGRKIVVAAHRDPKRLPLPFLGGGWPVEKGQVLAPHAAPLSLDSLRNSIRQHELIRIQN
jgi:hypothetical protein